MLSIREAVYRFKGDVTGTPPGVGPINLNLESGDFLIINGSNGSGKSTLLKLIDGSLALQSGEINFEGNDAGQPRERKRITARVFQDPALGTVSEFSVLENFRMASLRGESFSLLRRLGSKFRQDVKSYLAQTGRGFEDLLDRNVSDLSGGQRQVLTVLMNLYNRPSLLLLDEPTAALDSGMSEILLQILIRANMDQKITMMMISHDLSASIKTGNRLIIMRDGLIEEEISGEAKLQLSPERLYMKLNPYS